MFFDFVQLWILIRQLGVKKFVIQFSTLKFFSTHQSIKKSVLKFVPLITISYLHLTLTNFIPFEITTHLIRTHSHHDCIHYMHKNSPSNTFPNKRCHMIDLIEPPNYQICFICLLSKTMIINNQHTVCLITQNVHENITLTIN